MFKNKYELLPTENRNLFDRLAHKFRILSITIIFKCKNIQYPSRQYFVILKIELERILFPDKMHPHENYTKLLILICSEYQNCTINYLTIGKLRFDGTAVNFELLRVYLGHSMLAPN